LEDKIKYFTVIDIRYYKCIIKSLRKFEVFRMKKYSFLSIVFIVYLIVTFVSWLVGTGFEKTSYTFNVCLRICYSSAIGSIALFILLQFLKF